MSNIETKAYSLFLKYILNFFNAFNAFFRVLETQIHLLQPKSLNFFFKICQHFLKDEHLKPFSMNIIFSLKEIKKILNEINLRLECEEYLVTVRLSARMRKACADLPFARMRKRKREPEKLVG